MSHDSDTTFKVKRSTWGRGVGILWRPPAQLVTTEWIIQINTCQAHQVTYIEDAKSVVAEADALLILFSINSEGFQQRYKQITRLQCHNHHNNDMHC